MGEIEKVVLLFSNLNCRAFPEPKRNFLSEDELELSSTLNYDDCMTLQIIILEPSTFSKSANLSIQIGVGNNISLESNTQHALMARLYTLSGFCDTIPITFNTVDDLTYHIFIYIGVGSAIFLIFILTIISILIYCCLRRVEKRKSQ